MGARAGGGVAMRSSRSRSRHAAPAPTLKGEDLDHRLTTTALTIPGYRVIRTLGVVRGVTVRARWIGSQITASLRTLGGGQIPEYIELCEQTRAEAFAWMVQHAEQMGANAVIAVKYDATDLGNNMTEVLAYGTAAVVEPEQNGADDRRRSRRLGFAAAEHYDAYRPSYPAGGGRLHPRQGRLTTHSTVVDLAAGTGLMTRLLPPVGRLIAVEPLPEMREVLRARVPEAEVVAGVAEAMPLPAAVADARGRRAGLPLVRQPRGRRGDRPCPQPSGVLALVWNVRDSERPVHGEARRRAGAATGRTALDSTTRRGRRCSRRGCTARVDIAEVVLLGGAITLGQLKGRVLSTSYIALLDKDGQSAVMRQLESLVGHRRRGAGRHEAPHRGARCRR